MSTEKYNQKEYQYINDMNTIHKLLTISKSRRQQEIDEYKNILLKWLEYHCGNWNMGEICGIVQQLHFGGWELPPPPKSTYGNILDVLNIKHIYNDNYELLRHSKFIEEWLDKRYNTDRKTYINWKHLHPFGGGYYDNDMWTFSVRDHAVWCSSFIVRNELSSALDDNRNVVFKMNWKSLVNIVYSIVSTSVHLLPPLINVIIKLWVGIII